MSNVINFEFKGFTFRAIEIDGQPWFVAKDVCAVLGLSNVTKALGPLEGGTKGLKRIQTLGGPQNLNCVSEAGLYDLISRSTKPQAKEFRSWVNGTVLPAIRKDGSYVMGEEKVKTGEMSEDELIMAAMSALQRKCARVARGQAAWSRIKATAAEQRELWREVGEALLVGRKQNPSNKGFSDWCKEYGFDMDPSVRSNAMWYAASWQDCKTAPVEMYHPTALRQWFRENAPEPSAPSVPDVSDVQVRPRVTLDQAKKINKLSSMAEFGEERHIERLSGSRVDDPMSTPCRPLVGLLVVRLTTTVRRPSV